MATTNGGTKQLPTAERKPAAPLSLREAINRLFDDFGTTPGMQWPSFFQEELLPEKEFFAPRVDLKETEKELIVTAELPGVDPKELEVKMVGDKLVISGEKNEQKEEKHVGYYRSERRYGSFQRVLPLPLEVQGEKIEATYKDGVLRITMPKHAQVAQSTKKIEVKAN